MTKKDFDKLLDRRLKLIREVLNTKAGEYASDRDRMHNFKVAAKLVSTPETPEQALWGMLRKHLVSVIDMIDMTGQGECPSEAKRDEKIGAAINYLALLEGLLVERATAGEQG